jgi:hypothetical protein
MPAQSGRHRGRRLSVFLPLALASLTLMCSDGSGPSASETTTEYVRSLPPWDQFSPLLVDTNDITGPGVSSQELASGNLYRCTTAPYTITQTPDKIVTMDPDVNVLWLGALLQGRGYKAGIGSLAEWPVRERAPLTISIDLLSGNSRRVVTDPDLASVTAAIGELVQAAQTAGHRGGSSVSYSMEETHSTFQAGIKLGLSTRYFGPRITASIAAGRDASEKTITAHFVQRMFTVSIVLPGEPGELFSDEFTEARLREERNRGNVGSDNIPVYVANIVYGRTLLFSFTSNTTTDSIRAALAVSFTKDSGSVDGRYLDILSTARIGLVTVGGEGRNAAALIQSGKIADYFNEDAALTTARPISYTVRNLGDNSIAKVSETTSYQLKECEAVPTTGRITIDVTPNDATVTVLGPGGYSFGPKTGDQLLTELVPGGYAITVERAGHDSAMTDVSVAAGDALEVPVTLKPSNQTATGAIFDISPRRLVITNASCTGESQADVFHTITVNGRTLTNRPESASIPLYAGEFDDPSKGPNYWTGVVRDTVWFSGSRTRLAFSAHVWDSDFNAPDVMSSSSWSYTMPNIPVGLDLGRHLNLQGASCFTTFRFDITKVADIFTAAP